MLFSVKTGLSQIPRQLLLRPLPAFAELLRSRVTVGLPTRETRIAAPQVLLAVSDAPLRCFLREARIVAQALLAASDAPLRCFRHRRRAATIPQAARSCDPTGGAQLRSHKRADYEPPNPFIASRL